MRIFKRKAPCAPEELIRGLLQEVHEEAMSFLRDAGFSCSWDRLERNQDVRRTVGLEVSQRLLRGDLDGKVKAAGYRICEGK